MASKIKLKVPGEESALPERQEVADGAIVLKPLAAVRAFGTRGAAATTSVEVPSDALVEIELENGVTLWRRADAGADSPEAGVRGIGAERLDIPRALSFGPAGRGFGSYAVRMLRFFQLEALAGDAVEAAAAHVERQITEDGPGLYRADDPHFLDKRGEPDDVPTDRPVLVLLHGTASSTAGSFGKLAREVEPEPGEGAPRTGFRGHWQLLRNAYSAEDGREPMVHIYGLEHRTLTVSPVQNAIDLLNALPVGAKLHLVTHSRGGLIGELIARGRSLSAEGPGDLARAEPIDALDGRIFRERRPKGSEAKARTALIEAEADLLTELNRLLIAKRPVVERFVRVGCPARGTLLASDRLDLYFSVFVNLLGLVPGIPGNVLYQPFKAFAQAIIATRTQPEVLPGLEAQMPDSPLIAMINRHDVRVDGPLAVIAGDIEPEGLFRGLATIATDLFYREDHDLIVQSSAMLGGARREKAFYFFDKGGDVNHFGYFRNEATATKLVAALQGDDLVAEGFHPVEPPGAPLVVRGSEDLARERPVCFILPGIMGSHLSVKNDRIWLQYHELLLGRIRRLAVGKSDILPDGPIASYYGKLATFLGSSHAVRPFPYDWRLSLEVEAARLAREIQTSMHESNQPIRIVAHSMGGLVARMMIANHDQVWREMISRTGSRLIMLGTPNGGSASMAAGLMGLDTTIRKLERLDITSDMKELTAVVNQMPGVLELLPHDEDGLYYRPGTWDLWHSVDRDRWTMPEDQALARADKVRQKLDNSARDPQHMVYVAGHAEATPSAIDVVEERGRKRIRILGTAFGDGRVTWRTGLLRDVPTWYAPTPHGDLARDERNFGAILDLLTAGTTSKLATIPPATRGVVGSFEIWPEPMLYPDPAALETLPMGVAEQRQVRARPSCRVQIYHGDMAFAHHPILVGHYEGGELIGPEKALDRRLRGRLDKRRALGIYPGGLGTSEVVFGEPDNHSVAGAVVVGLGRLGELFPERLSRTLAAALMGYALRSRERPPADGAARENGVSCLIIGHRGSTMTVKDCVRAILDGVIAANKALDEVDRIRELEFVELFEDTAIEAADVLADFAADDRFAGQLDIDPHLGALRGARRRYDFADESEWQQRITIEVDNQDSSKLIFTTLDVRALARVEPQRIDRGRVDRYLARATADTWADEDVGKLLFEWLVPPSLKSFASDGRRFSFELDEEAAAYPWELLHDNYAKRPIALQASVIRQLRQPGHELTLLAEPGHALLIADPPSDFPPLPGAVAEVRAVCDTLRQRGWTEGTVEYLERPSEADIMPSLSLGEHQILHIAGHGVHEYGAHRISGLVIGQDQFITPEFVRTLRRMPEFVFLNCCHLGRVDHTPDGANRPEIRGRHALAANLAVAFIRGGARAVVAAGWEVDDLAAAEFASRLYERLLAGESFGEASLEARLAAHAKAPSSNTWGAYQCYGDPQYRLVRDPIGARSAPLDAPFTARRQAVVALGNIVHEASVSISPGETRELRRRLAGIEDAVRSQSEWMSDAGVLSALAEASTELDLFDKAIRYYGEAVRAEPAELTVQAIERMLEARIRAQFRSRRAGTEGPTRPELRDALKEAIERLAALNQLAQGTGTAARHRLIGDMHLRRASVADNLRAADRDLTAAAMAYEKARTRSAEARGGVDPTAMLAVLLVDVVRAWREAGSAETVDLGPLRSIEALAEARSRPIHNFSDVALATDAVALDRLAAGTVADASESILQGYATAWRRGASARELGVVSDRLYIVADLLVGRGAKPLTTERRTNREKLAAAVRRIAAEFELMTAAGE
jgi:hypothetical protein